MKDYIKLTDKGIVCTHPKVEKYSEYGGGPATGPFMHYVKVKLKDETEHEFNGEGDYNTNAIEELNNFLNTIPE